MSGNQDEGGPRQRRRKKGNFDGAGRLIFEIQQCNRTQDVDVALARLQELIDMGHHPSQDVFATVLNMACTQGPSRWPDVRVILDTMERHGILLGEAGTSSLIRLHMASGDAESALKLLHDLERQNAAAEQQIKRRHVLPLLEGACEAGNGPVAMHLLNILRRHDLHLQEGELLALITLCSHPGQEHHMGMVLTEMAQVVYQLSPEMASKAEGWFTAHGWQVHRTRIAPSGQCQHCGGQLLSVHAAASSVRRIKLMMERLMLEDLDGKSRSHELLHNTNIFRHGTPQGLRGAHLLNKFKVWLQQHGAYDLIIDGANLGFSKANAKQKVRNAAKGLKINFAVMDDVIQELRTMVQSRGHRGRALVVLHAQHVRENKLTPHDKAIVERWQAEDALYITPFGMNDDWFWLYAALEASEASRHTLLLSNDAMRDHQWAINLRIQLDDASVHAASSEGGGAGGNEVNLAWRVQEHQDFLRWQERHWATYCVQRGQGGRWTARFSMPLAYSVCIQALPLSPEPSPSSAPPAKAGSRNHTKRVTKRGAAAASAVVTAVGAREEVAAAEDGDGETRGEWRLRRWHLPVGGRGERGVHGDVREDSSVDPSVVPASDLQWLCASPPAAAPPALAAQPARAPRRHTAGFHAGRPAASGSLPTKATIATPPAARRPFASLAASALPPSATWGLCGSAQGWLQAPMRFTPPRALALLLACRQHASSSRAPVLHATRPPPSRPGTSRRLVSAALMAAAGAAGKAAAAAPPRGGRGVLVSVSMWAGRLAALGRRV